jgi:hypothetical protein
MIIHLKFLTMKIKLKLEDWFGFSQYRIFARLILPNKIDLSNLG